MSTSFIIFVFIVIVVVGVAGYNLGIKVNKLSAQESLDTQNPKPFDECVVENDKAFKYGILVDSRDGEKYRTIQIGNQVWMAENLRFKAENSFAPNGEEDNAKNFGRLYTWTTAMGVSPEYSEESVAENADLAEGVGNANYQGIAPEGWHIPSDKEWETLVQFISETTKNAGDELRSSCLWQRPGSDSFGFFALPAGYRFGDGNFCQFGKRARFWSKTEYGKCNAFRFGLTEEGADIEGVYRSDALSVRCVKNA